MNDRLTIDEYDALAQILKGAKSARPSACVARNAKRLAGLKYIAYAKNGALILTEKGQQTLFVKNCIDGLRAVATDPAATLDNGVATFLLKKGLITSNAESGALEVTQRGRETLADIDTAQ